VLIKPQTLILTFVIFILYCQVHFNGAFGKAVDSYTNFLNVIAGWFQKYFHAEINDMSQR